MDGVARVADKVPNAFGFIVGTSSFFIPFGDQVDVEAEKAKIKEMDHLNGFLKAFAASCPTSGLCRTRRPKWWSWSAKRKATPWRSWKCSKAN